MNEKEVCKLLYLALLVNKHASVSVRAELLLVELFAHFGLVFSARRLFFSNEILSSVGKLAFAPISAKALLNPILAHLGFVFGLVDAALDEGLCEAFFAICRLVLGGEEVGGFS